MVRFIIVRIRGIDTAEIRFTFHYGQIYYFNRSAECRRCDIIYIPLWLDLLSLLKSRRIGQKKNLHSTMVRFIILPLPSRPRFSRAFTFHYGQIYYYLSALEFLIIKNIYIPLWLDLLFQLLYCLYPCPSHLHSTMVRFIIRQKR